MIGLSDREFAPETYITKQELAVILIRAFDLEYAIKDLEVKTNISDINNLPEWSKKSVFLAESIGLMNTSNTEDGTMFLPKKLGNREEVSKLVYELLFNENTYEKAIKGLIKLAESDKTEETKKETPKKEEAKKKTPKKEESKPEVDVNIKEKILGAWKTSYSGITADITFHEDNTCYVEASIASATGTYSISKDSMSVSLMGRKKS